MANMCVWGAGGDGNSDRLFSPESLRVTAAMKLKDNP